MGDWNSDRIEKCLNKITAFVKLENHIIRAHPKNPRKGADEALRFKKEVYPEIMFDVLQSVQAKIMHGDNVDEKTVTLELMARINSELVKFGVAMIPFSDS